MAVIWLFDSRKRLKRPVLDVVEIIHHEGKYTATAHINIRQPVKHGDHFGFRCADGLFRLFIVKETEKNDEAGYITLSGYDAALAELNGRVLTGLSLKNTTAQNAAKAAINGTGWSLRLVTGDGEVNTEDVYFQTVWAALQTIGKAGGVRPVPYYIFTDGEITGRKIDLLDKTPVFRGLILTRKKGARNIHIIKTGMPYGRVYPVGKIIGSGDPPEQVTIADAVWSVANGDPADKPAGQLWVALPGAITDAEYTWEDKRETDPLRLLEKGFADLQSTAAPKASGTASIGDVEHVPGYEHRIVRMWDMLPVRTEDGETVETTVTNIDRYHVHKELTKISIGDEDDGDGTLENMLADLTELTLENVKSAGSAGARAGEAERMILEAEKLIQLNSKRIELNAKEILLRATNVRVDELETKTLVEFSEVYLDIDENRAELSATRQWVNNLGNQVVGLNATLTVQAGQIAAKASQYELDELANRVVTAESELKVQAGQISAKASQYALDALGNRMATAESQLTVQAGQIAAKASQYDVDALGNRVTTAESQITVQAGQIESKVSDNGVISAINQTSERVRIRASRVDLEGYVTASQLEANFADIGIRLETSQLIASQARITGVLELPGDTYLNGELCSWDSTEVVYDIARPTLDGEYISYVDHSGNKKMLWVCTGWSRQISWDTTTLYYLSHV